MNSHTSELPKILPACAGLDIDGRVLDLAVESDADLAARLERYVTTFYARFDGRIVGGARALAVGGPQVGALVTWMHALIAHTQGAVPRRIASLIWTDAITRAVAARLLAQVDHSAPPDQAFAIAFAWSLATATQLKGDAELQLRWWREVRRRPAGPERARFETKLLSESSPQHLARVVADWGLPGELLDVLSSVQDDALPVHAQPLRRLVLRADALACALSAVASGPALQDWLRHTIQDLGISSQGARKLTEEVVASVPLVAEAMGVPVRRWASIDRMLTRRGEPDVVSEADELAVLVELQREVIADARARVTAIEQELAFRARVDPITDLLTLQAFCARLGVEMGDGPEQVGSLVAIDVEDFGSLVGHYGLVHTDRTLALVAQVLDRVFREATLMTRCGPATFIVACPGNGRRTRVIAERAREALEQLSMGQGEPSLYVRAAVLNMHEVDVCTRPESAVELVRRRLGVEAHQNNVDMRRVR